MNKKIILLTLLLSSFFLRNEVFAADKSSYPTTCINGDYYNNNISSGKFSNDCNGINSNISLLKKLENSGIISSGTLTSIGRAIAGTDAAKCGTDCIKKIVDAVCTDGQKRTSTTSKCVDICDIKTQTYDTDTKKCKTKLVCPTDSIGTYPSCTCKVSTKTYNSITNICECPVGQEEKEGKCIAEVECALDEKLNEKTGECEYSSCPSDSTQDGLDCKCKDSQMTYNFSKNICECPSGLEKKDGICANTSIDSNGIGLTPGAEGQPRRNTSIDFDKDFYSKNKYFNATGTSDGKGAQNLILNIARDLRLIIFGILGLVILYMSLQLFISDKTEDQVKKYRKGIMWASIGIVVMQMAFMIGSISEFDNINAELGKDVTNTLILPFQRLMTLGASALFIFTGIRAFYRMVTASSNEKANEGKKAIGYAVIGFIIIKIADFLVKNTFSPTCASGNYNIVGSGVKICGEVKKHTELIVSILTKVNLYVGIFVILSIVYTGFLIITSNGDDEKKKKAKSNIINMTIGIIILFASYLIMTFFINKA